MTVGYRSVSCKMRLEDSSSLERLGGKRVFFLLVVCSDRWLEQRTSRLKTG